MHGNCAGASSCVLLWRKYEGTCNVVHNIHKYQLYPHSCIPLDVWLLVNRFQGHMVYRLYNPIPCTLLPFFLSRDVEWCVYGHKRKKLTWLDLTPWIRLWTKCHWPPILIGNWSIAWEAVATYSHATRVKTTWISLRGSPCSFMRERSSWEEELGWVSMCFSIPSYLFTNLLVSELHKK